MWTQGGRQNNDWLHGDPAKICTETNHNREEDEREGAPLASNFKLQRPDEKSVEYGDYLAKSMAGVREERGQKRAGEARVPAV